MQKQFKLNAIAKFLNPAAATIKMPRRVRGKQEGFIQNLIIPGLVLLGVVVGAIALLSSSGQGNTNKEQASANASGIVIQGIQLKEAITRAIGDGIPAASIATSMSNALVTNGYVTGALPAAPAGSQSTATQWAFTAGTYKALDSQATPADVGGSASNEDVLVLDKLTKDVCIRINNKLYQETIDKANDAAIGTAATATVISGPTISTSPNAAVLKVGNLEGCVPSATAGEYVYYKVVNGR